MKYKRTELRGIVKGDFAETLCGENVESFSTKEKRHLSERKVSLENKV